MLERKAVIRKIVAERKGFYTPAELESLSIAPLFGIETERAFKKSKKVAMYWSLPDEVNTHQFIEKWKDKKDIYLPVTTADEIKFVRFRGVSHMHEGAFKVFEPTNEEQIEADKLDLIVVPGLAFDEDGHRIGRGKGYYDKFLQKTDVESLGVAFPFQMFNSIPTEEHDINVDKVIY